MPGVGPLRGGQSRLRPLLTHLKSSPHAHLGGTPFKPRPSAPPCSMPALPLGPFGCPRAPRTHVVDLLLVLPAIPAVIHLGEDVLGDAGHPAIAVLVPGGQARRPPGRPGVGAHGGHQLGQVHRISGVEGQRSAVVAVTMRRVGTMMCMVGVWGVQGRGP